MGLNICIINGHPDTSEGRFVTALADAYAEGAFDGEHQVSRIDIAHLDFGYLDSADAFATAPDDTLCAAREKIAAADHVVLLYPLWLGSLPAKLKGFLEQVGRGGFFLDTAGDSSKWPAQKMKGKSARLIVTMGMPGFAYKLIFGAHSLKAIEQGIFRMSGFRPVRHTILGAVEAAGEKGRLAMLERVRTLGQKGI